MKRLIALILALFAALIPLGVTADETEESSMKISEMMFANAAEALERTEPLVYTAENGDTLNYRIYRSPAYKKDGDKAVLIVFLHGSGEKGDDNAAQIKGQNTFVNFLVGKDAETALRDMPYVIIAPQCPKGEITDEAPKGAQWVDTSYSEGSYSIDNTPITRPLELTCELMDSMIANENIDPDNIVVSGISMGGYGAWDLAQRRPDLVKTLVPICGGGDPTKASLIADCRVWAFHCDGDTQVPVQASRDMVLALEEAGCDVIYTEYEMAAHNAWWPAATKEKDPTLIEWIFDGVDYKATKADCVGGTLNLSAETVKRGEPLTVIATPDEGFVLTSLKINGAEVAPDETGSYTVEKMTANAKVEAVFEAEEISVDSTKDSKKNMLPWILGIGAAALAGVAAVIAIKRKKK